MHARMPTCAWPHFASSFSPEPSPFNGAARIHVVVLPQLTQLRKSLTGVPTGLSNLDNSSLRHPSQMILDCYKVDKTNSLL